MNNDPSFSIIGDEPVEARIVAWVLGEASAFESEELERLCAERPELLVFKRRMRALHGLLTEAEASQPDTGWTLPPEKRKALDEVFCDPRNADREPLVERRVRRAFRRAILSIAACVVLTLVVLFFIPGDTYESVAVIEVKSRPVEGVSMFGNVSGPADPARQLTPQFFSTEMEKIKSRASLEQVADKLGLEKRWDTDRETVIARLKGSIQVDNVRGSDLFSIRARADDPEDARQIASEVSKSYQAYRSGIVAREKENALAELSKAVRDQEDKVEERRKILNTITQTKGIIYKDGSREDAIKRGLDAQDYVDAERDFDSDRRLLADLKLKKVEADVAGRVADGGVEIHDDPATVEPERKSMASSLMDKVSSLGGLLGGRGESKAADAQVAMAEAPAKQRAREAAASLPTNRGMIEDRKEAAGLGELAKNLESAPAKPASVAPPAPVAAPVPSSDGSLALRYDALDSNEKAKDTTVTLSGATSYAGSASGEVVARPSEELARRSSARGDATTRATGDLGPPADAFADMSGVSSLGSRDSSPSGSGAGHGLGGRASVTGKPDREALAAGGFQVDEAQSGAVGLGGGVSGMKWANPEAGEKAQQEAKPKEDVAKVDGRVPTLDELPAVAQLFKKEKSTTNGVRSGDRPVEGSRIDLTLDRDSANVEFEGFVGYGQPILEGGLDANGLEHPASRPGADQPVPRIATREISREIVSNAPQEMGGKPGGLEEKFKAQGGGSLADLRKAVRDQEDRVEAHRKRLATIVNTKGIIYKGQDSSYQTAGIDEDQGARAALREFEQLESDRARMRTQVESLLKYEGGQLMTYAAGLDVPDNAVRSMLPGYQDQQRQLDELKARGLGANEPSIREAEKKLAAMKSQIEEATVRVRGEVVAQLKLAEESLAQIEKRKDTSREEAIKRGLDAEDYVDAKKALEREQEKLQQLKLSMVRSQIAVPAEPDLAKLSDEVAAADEPYSTFSLNVSDASFKIAQAALAKGERPDPAGVKVEQFYNAVDYGDPAPSGGMPVALAAERCAHPVIPGRDLVRVSVKTAAAGRGAAQPLRLTLLVDQSGSMVRADRRQAMEKALSSLAGLLTANDRVTLIGFSRTPHLLADGMSGDQAGGLAGMVHQEAAEGGTNLEEAIKLAEQLAKRHKHAGAQNRIVLFTDGAANLGDANPASLAERVKSLRQSGFAFDIAGIAADDINDGLLAELARSGNGRYSIVGKGDDGEFAERLAGAFRPAAENVKVQVRFNPERVARYKLIGFEKDRLKTEDFRNDAVDAAEMAAEEAGVAVYQIETIPGGRGELGEVSVRFRDAAAGGMVERSIVLGHSGAAPAIDKAPPSMQLAALSVLAAEKLRGGPLGAAVDFSRLAGPRASVRAFYGPGSRAAEMLQVIDRIQ